MGNNNTPWRSITGDNKLKTDLSAKLSEIADIFIEELNKKETTENNIGLIGGQTGVALFLFYYSHFCKEEKYYDRAMDILSEVFDAINEGFSYHTFSAGIAGVGWAIEHLTRYEFIEADTDELLGEVDTFIHKAAMTEMRDQDNYDFLHGATGCAMFLLDRHGNPERPGYIKEFLDALEEKSMEDKEGGIKWESVLNREDGTRGFNLSLSHGLASIIAFLANTYEQKIDSPRVGKLLDRSVAYLLGHTLDPDKFVSTFPSWVREGEPLNPSRLAWCYGDLGIGISLWQAGKWRGNKEWQNKAVDVLKRSTNRKDVKENSVIDAGLCHGASGIAHIYNRIYQYTGVETFKESALYWLDQTLKLGTHEDGYAGYKAWHTEKYGGWVAESGILEGVAGIGLALLAAVSDMEPRWDRCLLLS